MQFQILVRWPSPDILPMADVFDSATKALCRYQEHTKYGLEGVEILAIDGTGEQRIPASELAALSRAELAPPRRYIRRGRKAIASALLGMVASALPNGFGDFGVVSGYGAVRAARISRQSCRLPAGRVSALSIAR